MGKRLLRTEDHDTLESSNELHILHPQKKFRKETNINAHRTLFVRSLPATITSDQLTEFFSENYPLKHATVVLDPATKKSKGYGFVTFTDGEDAVKAKDELNGKELLGRKIIIELAEPRSRLVSGKDGMKGEVKSKISLAAAAIKKERSKELAEMKTSPKLIIRNLPWSIKTPEQLAKLFEKFGKVKISTLPKLKENKQAGFGFITMRGKKNAEKAMTSLNGTEIDGRILAVDFAVDKRIWLSHGVNNTKSEDSKSLNDGPGASASNAGSQNVGITDNPDKDNIEQEDDDVRNFLEKFGSHLESEEEEEKDLSDSEEDPSLYCKNDILNKFENSSEVVEQVSPKSKVVADISTTLFIRNLPFTTLDGDLKQKFEQFGPIRYARVVMDPSTGRPKGTGFVCFYKFEDAKSCYNNAPQTQPTGANTIKLKHSILEDELADTSGLYTIEGRILKVSWAVDRQNATKLTEAASNLRADRDKDKRKLYLLKEGTISVDMPLYKTLSPSEIKMREDSAMQRKKFTQNNPSLHLSLTRLSIRNIPRHFSSKDLKALARQAVVGFAKDVKSGLRTQLSKEEESRGGEDDRASEQQRKSKGKGIVRQAKIVFEGREGNKIAEITGAGRSRGYGFVEYYAHRWALMGLRWLNGYAIENSAGKTQRLIVEFAIENAQVIQRRKQSEEKARARSQEILKARDKGKWIASKG